MPNAKDASPATAKRVLAVGPAGSGKTTQILTLPGRKFVYIFDPNALQSLQGYDVDYEQFTPDIGSFAITSLTRGKGDKPTKSATSDAYLRWEEHFEQSLDGGFFQEYQWICFDSCTTLLDMIMDRVLTINQRPGQWPNQDDYGPQMNTFRNIMRAATSIPGVNFYLTGHIEPNKDEVTGRIFNTVLMTGKLRQKIPILFSDMLTFGAESDQKGNVRYTVRTTPDRMNPNVRCSVRDIDSIIDVTLDWQFDPVGQGLGRYLR